MNNNMKSFLFDISIMISFMVAAGTTSRLMSPLMGRLLLRPTSSECADEDNSNSSNTNHTSMMMYEYPTQQPQQQQQHQEILVRHRIPSELELEPESASSVRPSSDDDDDYSSDSSMSQFKTGSIVELHGDKSYFSVPAVVTGIIMDTDTDNTGSSSSSYTYSLHNSITKAHLPNVDAEFVHPYQIYEDGTRASCNVGALRKVYMTPCAILSHTIKKRRRSLRSDDGDSDGSSNRVVYQVSYLNKEGTELVKDQLPISRVQRIHGRRNGSRVK